MAVLTALPRVADASYECLNTIPATMVSTLDSAHAYPGQRFRFKTTAASIVRGVHNKKGTIGWGIVNFAAAASNRARNGAIGLEPRYLIVGKLAVQVAADPREPPIETHGQTLAEKGANVIPIIGLVRTGANMFRNGTDITVGPGFAFHLLPIGDLSDVSPCAVVQ